MRSSHLLILTVALWIQGCSVLGLATRGQVDTAYENGKADARKSLSEEIKQATDQAVKNAFTSVSLDTRRLVLKKEKSFLVDEDNRHSVESLLGSLFCLNRDSTVTRFVNILDTLQVVKSIQSQNQCIVTQVVDRGLSTDLQFLSNLAANWDQNSRTQIRHDKVLAANLELPERIDRILKRAKENYYTRRDSMSVEDYLFVTDVIVEKIRLKSFKKLEAGASLSYIGMKIDGELYGSDDVETEKYLVFIKGIQMSQVIAVAEKQSSDLNEGQKIVLMLKPVYPMLSESELLSNSLDSAFVLSAQSRLPSEASAIFEELVARRDAALIERVDEVSKSFGKDGPL